MKFLLQMTSDIRKILWKSQNSMPSTPFKKSNATRVWSIIFLLSWICIHQIRYPWKACSFALRLMPYLLGLFHWGVCRMSKLGAMSKRKKLQNWSDSMEMHAMSCFVLSFCERMHAYPLRPGHSLYRNPPNKTSCWIQISDAILEHYFLTLPLI